jgi:hypothetical protein
MVTRVERVPVWIPLVIVFGVIFLSVSMVYVWEQRSVISHIKFLSGGPATKSACSDFPLASDPCNKVIYSRTSVGIP